MPTDTTPRLDATTDAQAATLHALVHAQLKRQRWHLLFPPALEARYEADEGRQRSRHVLLGALLALASFDLFLFYDWAMRPGHMVMAAFWRLGVMSVPCLLLLWAIRRGLPPRWREGLLASTVVLGMWVCCEILRRAPGEAARFEPFLFSLLFLAGNLTFPLRGRSALLSSAASLGLASIYVSANPYVPADARQFSLGLMVASAAFTCLACYRMERSSRQAYLLLLREALRLKAAERMASEYAQISLTDALTLLPNRRAFDAALAQRWREARLQGGTLALLLLDVDRFKCYNDRYGHPAGDDCLRCVAAAMGASLRDGDLLARIGGEEFALLLAENRPGSASAAAERLRVTVQALGLPHADSPAGGVVTVSVGVATDDVQSVEDTPQTLIARADAALYEAKRGGRNRCALAPGTAIAPA